MFGNEKSNGKGITSLYDPSSGMSRQIDDTLRETVANEVIDQINREFPVGILAVAHGRGPPAHPGTHQQPGWNGIPAQQRLFRLPNRQCISG